MPKSLEDFDMETKMKHMVYELIDANLCDSDLTRINFQNANLIGANLKKANLVEATNIKRGSGTKGSWVYGSADQDATAIENVYNTFYNKLKVAIEEKGGEEIRNINKQLTIN
jgi:uncharacterized protein YjbI with pentapeptide repeats